MSSKASVRNFLEKSKRTKVKSSDKSSKKDKVSGGRIKSIEEVSVKELKFTTDSRPYIKQPKRNKVDDYPKVPVTFDNATKYLPINTWVDYELNRLYVDKKTGEYRRIYCKSAFYKGSYERKSYSTENKAEIVQRVMILKAGNRDWHLTEKDIHQIRVIKCLDYINTDFVAIANKKLGTKTKSLTHETAKPAKPAKTADKTKNKLLRRPKSVAH